ncbi:uncharacterized protein [Amphiura filiformis]|uniref:uncharacterized protein n=1 Tax=Amphiura filiformis TaxID=82378 RepID=UPI003B210494
MILLLSCVETNPGPTTTNYPCGICSRKVENDQQAIKCDSCDIWYHRECAVVTDHISDVYTHHSNLSWICIQCGLPNVGPSFFDSNYFVTGNSFESLTDEVTVDEPDVCNFVPHDTSTPIKHQANKVYRSRKNCVPTLKSMVINCDGLKGEKGRLDFQASIKEHAPDIIFGCESKLGSGIPSYSIFPEDYNVMRKDRNQSGGGVFLAVKGNFVSVEEPEFDAPCEIVWSSMEFVKAGRVFIGSFYRTPNNDFDPVNHLSDSLAKVLSKIKSHCNIIICGDFNFPDINWETGETKGDSRRKKLHDDFLDFLSESGLTQLNTLITRPRSQNVLDLICTNNPNVVSNIRTQPGVSDHDIVLFDLNLKPKRMSKPPRKIYNFKKAATQSIKEMLEANSRDFFLNEPMNKSVNENWTTFKNYVLNTTEKYVPHHFSKGKQSHPWIDHSIVKQMRKRDKLYSAAKKTKSKRLWASYKKSSVTM